MSSTKKNSELDAKMNEILELRKIGNFVDAIEKAKKLAKDYPNKGSVYGLLSSMYFETEQYIQAAHSYKQVTLISPASEMASLGLFHSLWEIGKREEAFEEAKRFMTISYSKDYIEILKNIKENEGT